MLAHDLILQPPMKNWRFTSRYLTADATAALDAACGALAQAGSALPTSSNMACAKEILTIYTDGKTVGGKTAFAGWDYRRMEPHMLGWRSSSVVTVQPRSRQRPPPPRQRTLLPSTASRPSVESRSHTGPHLRPDERSDPQTATERHRCLGVVGFHLNPSWKSGAWKWASPQITSSESAASNRVESTPMIHWLRRRSKWQQ